MIARAYAEPDVRGDLLNRYRGYLLVVAERSLDSQYQSRIDAEDIVQTTMMRAERSFKQFQGTTSRQFFQWLMTIHRNCLLGELSRQSAAKRDPTRESAMIGPTDGMAVVYWSEPSDAAVTPSVRMMRDEEALALTRQLSMLKREQRVAVRLRHIEGWSLSQIATRLNKSEDAVAGLIKRGLETLRSRVRI